MGEPPQPRSSLHVAIIGGGLSGLSLALQLHHYNISCTVYEASVTPDRALNTSIQFSPNGLQALEPLGIVTHLLKHSRVYKAAMIHDNTGKVTSELLLGDKEAFGYDSMRIGRAKLIHELASAVKDQGIEIVCEKKFAGVLSESKFGGVEFKFADGTTGHADLMIGADGIYSKVRRDVFPNAPELEYVGSIGVLATCARSDIEDMDEYTFGMFFGPAGAVIFGSQTPDDSEYILAVQRAFPDQTREEWEAFSKDKEKLRAYLEQDIETWPPYIRSAIKNAREDTYGVWVLRVLPQMESWVSQAGRVVLMGDAAHAMPPSAGQGGNQACEDANTLGLVLGMVANKDCNRSIDEALEFWQRMRQKRVQLILDMTIKWNNMRQSAAVRAKLQKGEIHQPAETLEAQVEQMRWVFAGVKPQWKEIEDWIAG